MAGKTGPTSPRGKAKVSRNALKHGIRASKWLNPDEQRDLETWKPSTSPTPPPSASWWSALPCA